MKYKLKKKLCEILFKRRSKFAAPYLGEKCKCKKKLRQRTKEGSALYLNTFPSFF